jgi:hypothetical protein
VQSAKGDLPSDSPATLLQFESTFLASVFLQLDVKFLFRKCFSLFKKMLQQGPGNLVQEIRQGLL